MIRSTDTCANCRFFHEKTFEGVDGKIHVAESLCRVNPPQIIMTTVEKGELSNNHCYSDVHPTTEPDSICRFHLRTGEAQ